MGMKGADVRAWSNTVFDLHTLQLQPAGSDSHSGLLLVKPLIDPLITMQGSNEHQLVVSVPTKPKATAAKPKGPI